LTFRRREEWYSQKTSAVLASEVFPSQLRRTASTIAETKVRSLAPLDPKYIGALYLACSYTEAFMPALSDFARFYGELRDGFDPILKESERWRLGYRNPNLKPVSGYEWSYGAVYSRMA